MNIQVPIISSSEFTWMMSHGSADISDLRDKRIFGKIYPNTGLSDQGFAVRSERTGKIVFFKLVNQEFDRNADFEEVADVLCWTFESTVDQNGDFVPICTIKIYND